MITSGLTALLLLAAATAVAANGCPAEQEQDWNIELLLKHPDCDKFYKCTYGHPVEQWCPPGLFFNLDNWQCDWPRNVDCGDRNVPGGPPPEPEPEPEPENEPEPEPEPEPKPKPEPEPEPEPEPQPEEGFLPNGCPRNPHIHWQLPHEWDCNRFYNCVWGGRVERRCASTLHFNRIIQVCDWPYRAGCEEAN